MTTMTPFDLLGLYALATMVEIHLLLILLVAVVVGVPIRLNHIVSLLLSVFTRAAALDFVVF